MADTPPPLPPHTAAAHASYADDLLAVAFTNDHAAARQRERMDPVEREIHAASGAGRHFNLTQEALIAAAQAHATTAIALALTTPPTSLTNSAEEPT